MVHTPTRSSEAQVDQRANYRWRPKGFKHCIVLSTLLLSSATYAQFVVNSTFKPLSYQEYTAPLRDYSAAFLRGEDQFESYLAKFNEQRINGGDKFSIPSLALHYINKCIDLNKRFNGNFGDQGLLYYYQSLVYYDMGEDEEEQAALRSAYTNGFSEDKILEKKEEDLFVLQGQAMDLLKKAFSTEADEDINSAWQCILRCFVTKEVYDVGTWGSLYYLYGVLMACEGRAEATNWMRMAANKHYPAAIDFIAVADSEINTRTADWTLVIRPGFRRTEDDDGSITFDRIRLSPEGTIIECTYKNNGYGWIQISPETYIRAGEEKFSLEEAQGIAITPQQTEFDYADETARFLLFFPPIPQDTKEIDLIEEGDSDWKFWGIQLQ